VRFYPDRERTSPVYFFIQHSWFPWKALAALPNHPLSESSFPSFLPLTSIGSLSSPRFSFPAFPLNLQNPYRLGNPDSVCPGSWRSDLVIIPAEKFLRRTLTGRRQRHYIYYLLFVVCFPCLGRPFLLSSFVGHPTAPSGPQSQGNFSLLPRPQFFSFLFLFLSAKSRESPTSGLMSFPLCKASPLRVCRRPC